MLRLLFAGDNAKDSLKLDLKCALLLPPNHSLLVEIKCCACSDGMRDRRPPANTASLTLGCSAPQLV